MSERRLELRPRTLALVVLLVGLVGFGAAGLWATPPTPTAPRATPARRTPEIRTAAGARRVAQHVAQLGQTIYDQAPAERAAMLRALAVDAVADDFVAQQTRMFAELDGVAERGTGPLTWDVHALATKVEAFTRHRARIAVWRVGILSIDGLIAPLTEWAIVTYELVWQHAEWRIWSESQRVGPTPMGHPEETPSTPRDLRDELRGFQRLGRGNRA